MNDSKNENNNVVDNSSLLELIQSIQDKMNNKTNENNEDINGKINNENSSNENNTTYTEKKNNVDNSYSNKNSYNDSNNNEKQNIDFTNLSSMLNNIDLSSVLGLLANINNNNSNSSKEENSSFNFDKLDPNLINKIQKIMMSMGKNDPRKDLLKSLKPFLRKSRQDKLGEYISMLSIINAIQIFYDKGSD